METGTGKTYVYLRTIFDLSKRYGFKKFIIVVPSVAIREGVTHSLGVMSDHFKAIYNEEAESFVYDARRVNRLRQFATANTLQIVVINIDAFRKNFTGTEDERKSNVIYKEMDRSLGGRAPIEFIQASRPIVIIDEPQSVDATDKAQEAIRALNPLCTLRYSATHKNPYNLVYRLDPVRAFDLRLVKQIVVASASADGAANDAFVKIESIANKPTIKAKLRIHVQSVGGPKPKSVTVKKGADLFQLSGERAHYRDGWSVAEIYAEPGQEFIRFTNGRTMRPGDEVGGVQPDLWRTQIRKTIEQHLMKDVSVLGRGIKVLSLFFIDRVANYRAEDGSAGPFAKVFEEEFAALAQ
jgi:type III restriction enzyme